MERTLHYLENPTLLRKRLGRAIGIVPQSRSVGVHQQFDAPTMADKVKA
jgi:hypothetical protein